MSKFELFAGLLYEGLSVWNNKSKHKYIERLKDLWQGFNDEQDKPSWEDRDLHPDLKLKDFRDNNLIDRYERELHKLGQAYLTASGAGENIRNFLQA